MVSDKPVLCFIPVYQHFINVLSSVPQVLWGAFYHFNELPVGQQPEAGVDAVEIIY